MPCPKPFDAEQEVLPDNPFPVIRARFFDVWPAGVTLWELDPAGAAGAEGGTAGLPLVDRASRPTVVLWRAALPEQNRECQGGP